MGSTDSSTGGSQQPNLPPGFRFHPTDEELVVHYLKRKAASAPLPVSIIADIDLYKFDPWELPAKATFGDQEWYFFSPRDRKYPNGARPNRAATSGYWKATGTDKPVMTSGGTQKVGVKKALVFYGGKPPKGIKTNWIMHEYRLSDNKPNSKPPTCTDFGNKKGSLRLDDWVLCRIYKKNNTQRAIDHQERGDDHCINMISPSIPMLLPSDHHHHQSENNTMLENHHHHHHHQHQGLFQGLMGGSNNLMINNNIGQQQQLIPSFALNPNANYIPVKQTVLPLPSNLYWNSGTDTHRIPNEDNNNINGGGEKEEEEEEEEEENSGSIVSLLSQLPQSSSSHSMHHQTYQQNPMGYQLQGFNWYS